MCYTSVDISPTFWLMRSQKTVSKGTTPSSSCYNSFFLPQRLFLEPEVMAWPPVNQCTCETRARAPPRIQLHLSAGRRALRRAHALTRLPAQQQQQQQKQQQVQVVFHTTPHRIQRLDGHHRRGEMEPPPNAALSNPLLNGVTEMGEFEPLPPPPPPPLPALPLSSIAALTPNDNDTWLRLMEQHPLVLRNLFSAATQSLRHSDGEGGNRDFIEISKLWFFPSV